MSKGAMARLCGYDWPGNVRELANLIERAAVMSPGDEISGDLIAPWLEGSARPPRPRSEWRSRTWSAGPSRRT
jgi:DNA-binding NtrC family response regulator